jgi:hypothetical protein
MKIIGLMPVKNESWILPLTLEVLSKVCDFIVIADQASEDDTRAICKQYPSVLLIDNNESGHSNKVRWKLLDAARNFDGNNLLLSIDADEFLPPDLFNQAIRRLQSELMPGQGLEFLWAQLWKSQDYFRDDDSVWSNNWKTIGFLDDRKLDYDRKNVVINDHTSRVPESASRKPLRVHGVPLVHLQWANWERAQVKQAWYRCSELMNGAAPDAVNEKYAITLDDPKAGLTRVPAAWFENIQLSSVAPQNPADSPWHLNEMFKWFDENGIEFFEELQIWHVVQLKDEFHKRTGRGPAPPTAGLRGNWKTRIKRLLQN